MSAWQPMKCGSCGGDTAKLSAKGSPDKYESIRLKCVGCKSVTVLRVEPARIEADWGKGSDGVFCTGWRDEEADEEA